MWLSERPAETPWEARRDLLASGPDDRHFVVEIDDDGRAWLRFGNGDAGKAPATGTGFAASIGWGRRGRGNAARNDRTPGILLQDGDGSAVAAA